MFLPSFSPFLPIDKRKKKEIKAPIDRLFPRNFPKSGEKSVPSSFVFCPSLRSRMVTGIEAELLL